jgi:hypothetical protein
MKQAVLFTLFIFLSVPLSGCCSQNYPGPSGREPVSDPCSWDFGQVAEGEVLTHAFILKNETQDILHIKDVSTSCGCATSKIEKMTILPGEATEIRVSFDSKGYSGWVQQFVYVYTDRTDNPIIKLTISGTVLKKMRFKGG